MEKIKFLRILLVVYLLIGILVLSSCSTWRVNTSYGFLSSDTYTLTNGDIAIHYYNGDCCCIAEEVLQELKRRIESGEVNSETLRDRKYANKLLREICKELKGENK